MSEEKKWTSFGHYYRDEKRRITVCKESSRYHDAGGNLCPSDAWIFYRDPHGFREGEFASAEEAMAAADKT